MSEIPDDLSIPDFLKTGNRKPLTPAQEEVVKAFFANRPKHNGERRRSTLVTGYCANIEEAGRQILREMDREAKRKEREKQKAKEENRERAKAILAMARAQRGKVQ